MERTKRWMTEVNGSLGGEPVIFTGIISEWVSDDGFGKRLTYNVTANYKKRSPNSFPAGLNSPKVDSCHLNTSLDAAKREFKSIIGRFGSYEGRISWKEE